jgi:hypothetical protein
MMKKLLVMVLSLAMVFALAGVSYGGTKIQQRDRDCLCDCSYSCDINGDGICDICEGCLPIGPDADGDGIPNGQDPDYVRPEDGSGQQNGR